MLETSYKKKILVSIECVKTEEESKNRLLCLMALGTHQYFAKTELSKCIASSIYFSAFAFLINFNQKKNSRVSGTRKYKQKEPSEWSSSQQQLARKEKTPVGQECLY